MTQPRRDLMGECNTERIPLNEFQDGWCRRCINPECARSLFGQSRFDLRVNSWEDRLFRKPPRMDPSDPRFGALASKQFITIDTSAPPEVRSWVDPVAPPVPAEPVRVPVSEPAPEVKAAPVPSVTKTEPAEPPVPSTPQVVSPEVLSINTQSQGGRMLSGVSKPQAPPPRDPWAAPAPAENTIPVGGRVKLRGSGV